MLLKFGMLSKKGFLFGEKRDTTNSQGERITTTQGLWNVPTTNVLSVGGVLYEYDLDEWLVENGFRDGSDEKFLLASTQLILGFSEMTKDRIELGIYPTALGIPVPAMVYTSPTGKRMTIMEDRAITESENGSGLLLDMDVVKKRVFSNNGISGEFEIIEDTEDKDDLGTAKTIVADCCVQWGAQQHHGKITGVTGGAKGRAI